MMCLEGDPEWVKKDQETESYTTMWMMNSELMLNKSFLSVLPTRNQ
jgi:hypothetical protein